MPIIQEQKFKQKDLEKTAKVVSMKLNTEEQALIRKCQYVLEQPKESTVIKELASIGAKVVLEDKTALFVKILLDNRRKNNRIGIVDVKTEIDAKVKLKEANQTK